MRIGIDLGGTKIQSVLLHPDGRELARRRQATPRGDYEATVETLVTLVGELDRLGDGQASVGLGIPGM